MLINQVSFVHQKQTINLDKVYNISYVMDIEKQIIDFIKQTKGEIPLPHLQENIEKFIESYDKDKVQNKKRILKR